MLNRCRSDTKIKFSYMSLIKAYITNFFQIDWSIIVSLKKLQACLTYRGCHVVVQPFQCTYTLFTFTSGYWRFTSNLQRNINITTAAVTGDPCSIHSVLGRNEFIQLIMFSFQRPSLWTQPGIATLAFPQTHRRPYTWSLRPLISLSAHARW